MLRLFTFLFLLAAQWAGAQVQDDFSDGNLSSNPAWQGDVDHFTVNGNLELQLDAPGAGSSTLWLPVEIADSNLWECRFRMDFNPSNSNRLRIYLMADDADFGSAKGYFLLIGKDGSDDAIEFYLQEAGTTTLLATATPGAVATAPDVRLRMQRLDAQHWQLEADYNGGQNFQTEFNIDDGSFPSGNYFFGFQCTYTATRTDKFFFDDILVSPIVPDTAAPKLLTAEAVDSLRVLLHFDEEMEKTSAENPANYQLDQGIGTPAAATLMPGNTAVELLLATPLQSLTTYTLTASGLTDLAGNVSGPQSAVFTFVKIEPAAPFDVLINELMADPSPPVGLPDAEYVELYNRSQKIIELEGFSFSNGGSPQPLPTHLLFPGDYITLCDEDDAPAFAGIAPVLPLPSMPALTNSGDELFLFSPSGNVIHSVSYSTADYGDAAKADGGWSLELINPAAPCRLQGIWHASTHLSGGTPGQPNSVLNEQPDLGGPRAIRVFATADDPDAVALFFDKALDEVQATDPDLFSILNGPQVVEVLSNGPASVILLLAEPLLPGEVYELEIAKGLSDCNGRLSAAAQSLFFAIPEAAQPNDVVINELLFNPQSGGSDFVELYNRSQRAIDLSTLLVGNLNPMDDTVVVAINAQHLLLPGAYAVLSPDTADIAARYQVLNHPALIQHSLPPFDDDAGNVTLYRLEAGQPLVIDAFDYNEDMHQPLLDDLDGVSLERIHPDAPSGLSSSWHSAAQAAGFATPTYRNSQYVDPGQPATNTVFSLPAKTFSPDGDGFEDFLLINYQTDLPGYSAKAHIYDAEGRPVKRLVNNELLGTNGFFRWDGDTDDGSKAPVGVYIIWLQLFHPTEAKTITEKLVCVLAGRLD